MVTVRLTLRGTEARVPTWRPARSALLRVELAGLLEAARSGTDADAAVLALRRGRLAGRPERGRSWPGRVGVLVPLVVTLLGLLGLLLLRIHVVGMGGTDAVAIVGISLIAAAACIAGSRRESARGRCVWVRLSLGLLLSACSVLCTCDFFTVPLDREAAHGVVSGPGSRVCCRVHGLTTLALPAARLLLLLLLLAVHIPTCSAWVRLRPDAK